MNALPSVPMTLSKTLATIQAFIGIAASATWALLAWEAHERLLDSTHSLAVALVFCVAFIGVSGAAYKRKVYASAILLALLAASISILLAAPAIALGGPFASAPGSVICFPGAALCWNHLHNAFLGICGLGALAVLCAFVSRSKASSGGA